jgi:uncharacterized protein (DUF433 family)
MYHDGTIIVTRLPEGTRMREPGSHLLRRITTEPGKCGGKPCIRGMRIRVADILELLANNVSPEQILADYPDLEAEDIHASLRFAAERANHARLVA